MFRFGRFILAFVLVAVLVGAGAFLFRAGMAQGYQMAAISATAPTAAPGTSNLAPAMPAAPYFAPYGYGYGPRFGPWGYGGFFNPFGALLGIGFFFLMIFVVGSLFRLLFFRGFAHRGPGFMGHGRWGNGPQDWEKGVPPMFHEWHEREHKAPQPEPQQPAPQE
jgi:hypothetical protein